MYTPLHPQQDTEQVEECLFFEAVRERESLCDPCLCVQLLKEQLVPITHVKPKDNFRSHYSLVFHVLKHCEYISRFVVILCLFQPSPLD